MDALIFPAIACVLLGIRGGPDIGVLEPTIVGGPFVFGVPRVGGAMREAKGSFVVGVDVEAI